MIYLLTVSGNTSINGITFVTGLPSNGRTVTIINNYDTSDNAHNITYMNQVAGATGPLWVVNNNNYTSREQGATTFVYFSSGLNVVTSGWVMTSNSG